MIGNGQSKGYGFVCFSTDNEALNAIKNMNGKELGRKPIYVTLWKNSKQSLQITNVWSNSEVPIRQSTPIYRLSNRLPSRLYSPSPNEQTDLNDNHQYSSSINSTPSTQDNDED